MKNFVDNIFKTATHLGLAWMIIIIIIFVLTMIFNIRFIPTWLWLILIVPGFAMIIADREPDSVVGSFGLSLYKRLNIFSSDSYVPTHVVSMDDLHRESDINKNIKEEEESDWDDEIFDDRGEEKTK